MRHAFQALTAAMIYLLAKIILPVYTKFYQQKANDET